jgi:hypothetical protein
MFMLVLVQVGLQLAGYQPLISWIEKRTLTSSQGPTGVGKGKNLNSPAKAEHVLGLVAKAAHHGFYKANCLRRAITAWWLLRTYGFLPDIRFGAKKNGSTLAAHAWIEINGRAIGESADLLTTYPVLKSTLIDERKG